MEVGSAQRFLAAHWPTLILFVLCLLGWAELRGRVGVLEQRGNSAPEASSTAQPAPWACDGSLTGEQVRSRVGESGQVVFQCHSQHASAARGSLELMLLVREDGTVASMRAEGPLANQAEMLSCIQDQLESWRFPPPVGGCAVVSVPFMLGGGVPSSAPAN